MKISVYNFKSISKLEDFEIKPFTIIAGVNNSGKSSFFQFLLLIKQTLELASTAIPLSNRGEFTVSRLSDLVFSRDLKNEMGIKFSIALNEFADRVNFGDFGVSPDSTSAVWEVLISYRFVKDGPVISRFELCLYDPETPKNNRPVLKIVRTGHNYTVETNVANFGPDLKGFQGEAIHVKDLRFESIFPLSYGTKPSGTARYQTNIFDLVWLKDFIQKKLGGVSYIGPVRESPQEAYVIDLSHSGVGVRGEYAAQVLQSRRLRKVSYFRLLDSPLGVSYESRKDSLLSAVKYWMCDQFGIGKDILPKKVGNVYQIFFLNELGFSTTIDHVGFGVSQLLPIIIEGLLLPNDGTLLLEEPESHLHPKLQSILFDFLYSLVRAGKTVVIETHSDHLINRMRRRVAESPNGDLADDVGLSFITPLKGEAKYMKMSLDEFGISEFYPEDFVELSNVEFSAILEAQMRKRLRRSTK